MIRNRILLGIFGALISLPFHAQETYRHLIIYGQSLSIGSQSYPLLTSEIQPNSYMLGSQLWINFSNTGYTEVNPLLPKIVGGTPSDDQMKRSAGLIVECPLYSVVNHIQRKTGSADKILATSAGYHGRSIEELSKGSNTSQYYNDFLRSVI
ncbi:MAG: hypothetical protein LBS25_04690, partial [Candidatus Symbiothrix sp.]|nr:hypothetical protein [Candidatus Symbiothrix sp.]